MPITYPAAAATISGDLVTTNRFLNSPALVSRRLRDIALNRFIGDVLLSGRTDAEGGAITYEVNEGQFADRAPEVVAPGSEYPLTTVGNGQAQIAKVSKWGQDVPITDESIKRQNFSPVERAMTKLTNTMVQNVDGICLSLIATVATNGAAVGGGAWSSSTATILRDVLRAKAAILALNQGYDPDYLVVDDATWANVASDPTLINARAREGSDNSVYTGAFPLLAGLQVISTPNLPSPGTALVVDSKSLGGIADENLGGPGYTGGLRGVEGKAIRDDHKDRWLLRARRVFVPYIQEPGAAFKITGV